MAVFLKELYETTKDLYHLQLLAGEEGLNHVIRWVYISEDITTSSFLNGGELIITTGVTSNEQKDWLKAYLLELIGHQTSGLIINTGKYIFPEDITDEILLLCQEHQFPLFLMPWEIKIMDITHHYYQQIFEDVRADDKRSLAFLRLILEDTVSEGTLHELTDTGFVDQPLQILSFDTLFAPSALRLLYSTCKRFGQYHICIHQEQTIVIFCTDSDLANAFRQIPASLHAHFPESTFHCGCGSLCTDIKKLRTAYLHAVAAAQMAACMSRFYYSYKEMGFYKILLEVSDPSVLNAYVREQLGSILDYDRKHNSHLAETLHQYLLCSGSVQLVAERMFCHRNTINYRLRILREDLGLSFEDATRRFELMAAYQISDFNNCCNTSGCTGLE